MAGVSAVQQQCTRSSDIYLVPYHEDSFLLPLSIHSITSQLEALTKTIADKETLLLNAAVHGNIKTFTEQLRELLFTLKKLTTDLKSLLTTIQLPAITQQQKQLSLVPYTNRYNTTSANHSSHSIGHSSSVVLRSNDIEQVLSAVIATLTEGITSHLIDLLKHKRIHRLSTSESFKRDFEVTFKYIKNIQSSHLLKHCKKLNDISSQLPSFSQRPSFSVEHHETTDCHCNNESDSSEDLDKTPTKSDYNQSNQILIEAATLSNNKCSPKQLKKTKRVLYSTSSDSYHLRKEVEPTHHELLEVLSDIAYQWSELGDCLHVKHGELSSLRQSSRSDMEKLSEVLQKWKEQEDPPYTWSTVLEILSGPVISNRRLSTEMERFLTDKKIASISLIEEERATDSSPSQSTAKGVHCNGDSQCNNEDITDKDLLRCSRYIDRDPTSLCGYLGFPDDTLEDIRRKNKKQTVQAHCLLKKWKEDNPLSNRQQLSDILDCLGFKEAAKNVFAEN